MIKARPVVSPVSCGGVRAARRVRCTVCALGAMAWVGGLPSLVYGQVFTQVTSDAVITFAHGSTNFPTQVTHGKDLNPGAAAVDYDNDGDIDLFIPNLTGDPNELYRNNGDGTFTEVAAEAGVQMAEGEAAQGIFFDYDADGFLDLFVTVNASPSDPLPEITQPRLFRNNGDGTFSDVTFDEQIPEMPFRLLDPTDQYTTLGSTNAVDIDVDGDLDVYICFWRDADRLLINNGDGAVPRFTDVTEGTALYDEEADNWQALFHDFNNDGLPDILQMTDFRENHLYINHGDLVFEDIAAEAEIDFSFNEMGGSLGDVDNDGDLDVYIGNIEQPFAGTPLTNWNELFINETVGQDVLFSEIGVEAGVANGGYTWGVTLFDYDNDGWLDIAIANGRSRSANPVYETDPSKVFRNLGFGAGDPRAFEDVSAEVGYDDNRVARTVIAFDYDRDGDQDLFLTNQNDRNREDAGIPILYRNDGGNDNNWVVIDPFDEATNDRGIGAVVSVTAGGMRRMRIISAGTSFLGQEPDEAHFGLGDAATVDVVQVRWPDGTRTVLADQPIDTIITVAKAQTPTSSLAIEGPTSALSDEAVQFTSIATLINEVQFDVTTETTWTVDPPGSASFDAPGQLRVGQITAESVVEVRAEYDGVSTTLSLTLSPSVVDGPTDDGNGGNGDGMDDGDAPAPVVTVNDVGDGSSIQTDGETIELSGTVVNADDITSITWSVGSLSGICTIGTEWVCGPITLQEGVNAVTLQFDNASGGQTLERLTVTRQSGGDVDDGSSDDPGVPGDGDNTGNDSQDNGGGANSGGGGGGRARSGGACGAGILGIGWGLVALRFTRRRSHGRGAMFR